MATRFPTFSRRPVGDANAFHLLVASLFLCFTGSLFACQVPVFRYALERWWPDLYQVVVVHRGDLTAEQKGLLELYEGTQIAVNFEIEVINLDEADPETLERFHGIAELGKTPTLALYYPDAPKNEPPVFTSSFTRSALDRIVDSPARQEIASGILKGDSAVWVVLDGGSEGADESVQRLRKGLEELAGYMELPEGVITPEEADELMERARAGEAPPSSFDPENILNYGVPLRLGFSVVRVDIRSEKEDAFVRMLLAADPDLDPTAGPVAIPVFGRGRMLQGLPVDKLIDDEILPDACYYICGACSCQVKGQNPGLDLLMKVDWEGALEGHTVVIEKELPPLAGAGDILAAGKETDHSEFDSISAVPVPSPSPNPVSTATETDEKSAPQAVVSPIGGFAATVGGLVLLIGIASFLIVRRKVG